MAPDLPVSPAPEPPAGPTRRVGRHRVGRRRNTASAVFLVSDDAHLVSGSSDDVTGGDSARFI